MAGERLPHAQGIGGVTLAPGQGVQHGLIAVPFAGCREAVATA